MLCSIFVSGCSIQLPSLTILSNDQPLSPTTQLDSILHLNATVNLNLREIDELVSERAKLISKVHAASLDASGLPHLSVSELALTKRLAGTRVLGEDGSSEKDRRRLREFRDAGALLDACTKWLRKRHIFFDWMVKSRGKTSDVAKGQLRWDTIFMINVHVYLLLFFLILYALKEKISKTKKFYLTQKEYLHGKS